jgi:hypothetical protein
MHWIAEGRKRVMRAGDRRCIGLQKSANARVYHDTDPTRVGLQKSADALDCRRAQTRLAAEERRCIGSQKSANAL